MIFDFVDQMHLTVADVSQQAEEEEERNLQFAQLRTLYLYII